MGYTISFCSLSEVSCRFLSLPLRDLSFTFTFTMDCHRRKDGLRRDELPHSWIFLFLHNDSMFWVPDILKEHLRSSAHLYWLQESFSALSVPSVSALPLSSSCFKLFWCFKFCGRLIVFDWLMVMLRSKKLFLVLLNRLNDKTHHSHILNHKGFKN